MNLPRGRLTIGRLMGVVAIVAVAIPIEMRLANEAISSVQEGDNPAFALGDAIAIWVFLNSVVMIAALLLCKILRGFHRP
jgi:hypothetical protein